MPQTASATDPHVPSVAVGLLSLWPRKSVCRGLISLFEYVTGPGGKKWGVCVPASHRVCVCVLGVGAGEISRLVKICSRPAVQQTHSNTPEQFIPGITVLTAIWHQATAGKAPLILSAVWGWVCAHACVCIVPHWANVAVGHVHSYQYSRACSAAQGRLNAGRRLDAHVPSCSDWLVMKNALGCGRFYVASLSFSQHVVGADIWLWLRGWLAGNVFLTLISFMVSLCFGAGSCF